MAHKTMEQSVDDLLVFLKKNKKNVTKMNFIEISKPTNFDLAMIYPREVIDLDNPPDQIIFQFIYTKPKPRWVDG
jgi:hypothetical protein